MRTLAFLLPAVFAFAAEPEYYPFSINQDAVQGAPDFSFLNHPLTAADRLFVRNGHFYRVGPDVLPNTADDERVRLFGVNLAFSANFPNAADAERVAKRLRRLGVNLVRLHHMDTQPDQNPTNAASLLTTGPYPTINVNSAALLKNFIRALAAEGVYVNLNLHVGYTFRPTIDGVPSMTPAIPNQSKPLHIFYPRMVELQQEFTRLAIDALELQESPSLAMVEISNEDSLLWEWQVTALDNFQQGPYLDQLTAQWNSYLRGRYTFTEDLRKAWQPAVDTGPQVLGRNWVAELHTTARANLRVTDAPEGQLLDVEFVRGGDTIIIKQTGFSLTQGRTYTAEVEMRADLPEDVSRPVYWDVKQDVSPWRSQTGMNIGVSNRWQRFTMQVRASFSMDGIGRFGLSIENVGANVQIRGASLREAGEIGLRANESLTGANVALVRTTEYSARTRTRDFLDFLVETDRSYLNRMLTTVREKTGELTPVAGTQIGFGGLMTIDSHRDLDYHDNHFYVDHYNFPNVQWDGRDWRIRDNSTSGGGLSAILSMAASRVGGKPFTVSEYNQPWPNQQAAEIDPLVSIAGAFQDWDSVMHFAYSHSRNWDDGVPNGFNINGDWTKWIGFGQSAWLFRSGAVSTANATLDLPVSRADREQATVERRNGGIVPFLNSTRGYQALAAVEHAVRLADAAGDLPVESTAAKSGVVRSDTDEFTYDAPAKLFLLHSKYAAGLIGVMGREEKQAGPLKLRLADSARGFSGVLLTPADQLPLAESRRLLLSVPGQTLRTQPGTNTPQRLINYPGNSDWWTLQPQPGINKPSGDMNGGQRPTFLERVECFVSLDVAATRATVYPLDGSGVRLPALSPDHAMLQGSVLTLHLQAEGQQYSPWYEIVLE